MAQGHGEFCRDPRRLRTPLRDPSEGQLLLLTQLVNDMRLSTEVSVNNLTNRFVVAWSSLLKNNLKYSSLDKNVGTRLAAL
jgi:hypothetical protein